jgi:replicative DNA helicase
MDLSDLPSDVAAEEMVLSSCVTNRNNIRDAVEILGATGAMFHDPANAVIYEAIVGLDNRNVVPDGPTLKHYLRSQPSMIQGMTMLDVVGGEEKIDGLMTYSTQNIGHYAQSVWGTNAQRKMIRAGAEVARLGYLGGGDVHQLLSQAEQTVYDIRSTNSRHGVVTAEEVGAMYWAQFERQIADPEYHRGWKMGIPNLDAIMGYVDPGRLIVMAGRPGFGKTTTSLWIARDMAVRRREPVMIAVYEQGLTEHMNSLMAMQTGIDSQRLKHPQTLEAEEVELAQQAMAEIVSSPLYFIELVDPVTVTSSARRISIKAEGDHGKPLAMLIVDYLGLLPPMPNSRANTRDQEVGEISRHLKLFSQEMEIVTILVSQLNRESERRSNHVPMLSDLRESGNIEQDADIVVFTYCPLQYMNETQQRQELARFSGEMQGYEPYEHIVAKWRAGRTGTAHNAWHKPTSTIMSLRTRP